MNIAPDRIKASFLLGACGDALGAPIEEIKSLSEIFNRFGAKGLSDMIPQINAFGTGVDYPAGGVTDDTAHTMTTAGEIVATLRFTGFHAEDFARQLRRHAWQGLLHWGAAQDARIKQVARFDKTITWDDAVTKFWFERGAGAGTIAALLQPEWGTPKKPRVYTETVRGKEIKSPNLGCGGMMRAAPFSFLPMTAEDVFERAAENAAITNGHPEAYVAAGAIAVITQAAAQGYEIRDAIGKAKHVLKLFRGRAEYRDGIENNLKMIDAGVDAARAKPLDMHVIDALPKSLGYDNPFLAPPVLAQVVYAASSATAANARETIIVAANHGGDSDSVASIVGNIVGARYGMSAVPQDWSSQLIHKDAIDEVTDIFVKTVSAIPPAPKGPPPKPEKLFF